MSTQIIQEELVKWQETIGDPHRVGGIRFQDNKRKKDIYGNMLVDPHFRLNMREESACADKAFTSCASKVKDGQVN